MSKTFQELVIDLIASYAWPREEEQKAYLSILTDQELYSELEDFISERISNAMIVD